MPSIISIHFDQSKLITSLISGLGSIQYFDVALQTIEFGVSGSFK
jgi:hypothetical protein